MYRRTDANYMPNATKQDILDSILNGPPPNRTSARLDGRYYRPRHRDHQSVRNRPARARHQPRHPPGPKPGGGAPMKGGKVIAWATLAGIAACTVGVATSGPDRTDADRNEPPKPSFKPGSPKRRAAPELADDKSASTPTLTYTGPESGRPIAAAAMDVLQKHCFGVVMYLDRFSTLQAAYIELPDQDKYGVFAGGRAVWLTFGWKPGAWPKGAPHDKDASFVFTGGQGRGITTSGSGIWLCGSKQTPKRPGGTVFIPVPEVSLSAP